MSKIVGAVSCLAVAAAAVIVAGEVFDIGWGGLMAIWLAWLALPVVLTALAVLTGYGSAVRGLVITGATVGATVAFHMLILDLADPFAFMFLPPLTLLVLLATLVMLSLQPLREQLG